MNWQSTLTAIAACGGVGGAIDFCIGKAGQVRVRGWLETCWLKMNDVTLNNFGRKEARFAVSLMDNLVGARLFSSRRLVAVTATWVCTLIGWWVYYSIEERRQLNPVSFFS